MRADNGTLTLNGAIRRRRVIGTADADGMLHVTNAWNNNVTTGVQLNGGTLQRRDDHQRRRQRASAGMALVTARVINNTQLFASIGGTLVFQTAGNDNDWDGTTNTGDIDASSAQHSSSATSAPRSASRARCSASDNRAAVFANGFALDFNPGSTLNLASGGTYRSTSSAPTSAAR